ncbi:MAG: hypothetical protein JWO77_3555 [Ilumatobacteraceae bacterium]|nr:hypothetical protein [Ilumatobacteraceae bacterium]
MQITMTLNPEDPTELASSIAFLQRLTNPTSGQDDVEVVRGRVRSLLRGYGSGRLNYVRLIAERAPERVPVDEVVALFDSPKAIGGTHSSIERSWRSSGGSGMFIETDRHGDSRMDANLAAIALEVLAELPPP